MVQIWVSLAIFTRWAKSPLTLRRLGENVHCKLAGSRGNAQYQVARTLRQGQAVGKQKMTKLRQNDQICGKSVPPGATEYLPTVVQIGHKDPIKIRKEHFRFQAQLASIYLLYN